jgi:hypothetical protein
MPLIPKRTVVPKVVDDLPPLCAFVVDDDRYVFPLFSSPSFLPNIPSPSLMNPFQLGKC